MNMGRGNDFEEIEEDYVATSLRALSRLSNLGKITFEARDDALFERRVEEYFNVCQEMGIRPGIETLCLALRVDKVTLDKWERGQSSVTERRSDAVKQAKQLVYAFLEQCGMSGKINPVAYVWLSKNWMKYTDRLEINADLGNNDTPRIGIAELTDKYNLPAKDLLD